MPYFLLLMKLALRNILRHRTRIFLVVFMAAGSLALLMLAQSLMAGRNQDLIKTITSTFTGDLQIQRTGYLDHRKSNLFFNSDDIVQKLNAFQISWAPRIYLPAIISSSQDTYQINFVGISGQQEAQITQLKSFLKKGNYFEFDDKNCDQKEILIGEKLANLLHVDVGSKIVFLAQGIDGSLGNELFRIRGIFDSKSKDFDEKVVYGQIPCVQSLGAINGIHEIVLKVDADELANTQTKISQLIISENQKDLKVYNWQEIMPEIGRTIRANNATVSMLTLILFLVILLGLINTFMINIFERTKEIGMMLALGTSPFQVRVLIFF